MTLLCYTITGATTPNKLSTTGAEDGHIGAVLKSNHEESKAQVYSEIVANKLAMFLGIPVITGVPARRDNHSELQFAALKAFESNLSIYDFTSDSDEDDVDDVDLPSDVDLNAGHLKPRAALCAKYPLETSNIAVFDLWIGNADRAYNFKAELEGDGPGVIFALDHGSSLLSCRSTIDASLETLTKANYPSFHPFQRLVNPIYCGAMVERICSMPDWAIQAATTHEDAVGGVTLPDQFMLCESLIARKKFLVNLVNQVLIGP